MESRAWALLGLGLLAGCGRFRATSPIALRDPIDVALLDTQAPSDTSEAAIDAPPPPPSTAMGATVPRRRRLPRVGARRDRRVRRRHVRSRRCARRGGRRRVGHARVAGAKAGDRYHSPTTKAGVLERLDPAAREVAASGADCVVVDPGRVRLEIQAVHTARATRASCSTSCTSGASRVRRARPRARSTACARGCPTSSTSA